MVESRAVSYTHLDVYKRQEFTYIWVGKNKAGKIIRGEQRATSEAVVNATLRRQGVLVTKVSKQGFRRGGQVTEKDVALFTRQLATMMKAGVPLLQTFDIVGRGHDNPAVGKLLLDIKSDVETGSSLSQAFRKFPLHFDQLYCNPVSYTHLDVYKRQARIRNVIHKFV